MSASAPDLKTLFSKAIELADPAERARYVEQACGDNVALRAEVESLLHALDKADNFLEAPAVSPAQTVDQPALREGPGTVIGPYKLLQQIGEGGMGAVFMAEQTQPVQRKVALKIIKPGMDSKQVIARFEAERQALALMDHPHIAKVFDGGTTASGRPYVVMELVKGVPLTKYCDEHHLTPRDRLELFVPVCQAVQHAHQKGIIHRDLKPSNVLIALYDGRPVPKVIDFGVAKATGQKLTERTLFTDFGAVVGTLEYMSPEQAELNNLDIDTRSDIYALGALLYELLTGTTPLEKKRLKEAALLEVLRIIREEEPPRPSTRLSTTEELPAIAANRGLEPKKLSGLVKGELDWIVMKWLEKDRIRRYDTANGLARDIEHYLHDEPVQACPPSTWYRLRKFARRNKAGLAMASVGALALLLVVGSIGWMARDRAARQTILAQEITRALEETELWYQKDRLPEAIAAAKRADALLSSGAVSDELEKRVRQWRADLALVQRLEGIRLEKAALKQQRLDIFGANPAYQKTFQENGLDLAKLNPAEAAERIQASLIKDQLVAALDDWAMSIDIRQRRSIDNLLAIARAADPDPWRGRLRDAFQRRDRKALEDLARDREALEQAPATVLLLVRGLSQAQERSLALEVLRQAQQRHPADFWINFELAGMLSSLQTAQARTETLGYFRAAVARRPQSPIVHFYFGSVLRALGNRDAAEAAYRQAIRVDPDYAVSHWHLGQLLNEKGALAESETEYRLALRIGDAAYDKYFRLDLARALERQNKLDEAEVEYRHAVTRQGDANAHLALGEFLLGRRGKAADAEKEFQEAIRLQPDDISAHLALIKILLKQGKTVEADAQYQKAVLTNPKDAQAHYNLAYFLVKQRKFLEAEGKYREALALKPDFYAARIGLIGALLNQGKRDEVEAQYKECVRLHPDNASAHHDFGFFLSKQGKLHEAEEHFRKAVELEPSIAGFHHNLGVVLKRQKKWNDAIAAFKEAIRLQPDGWGQHFELAQLLTTCPVAKLRNPERALESAKKAVEIAPKHAASWNVLGLARYRAADYRGSIEALEKAIAMQKSGSSWHCFFLAMAHWQLGNKDEARTNFDQAVKLQPNLEVFRSLREEAATLLGIEDRPKTKPNWK